MSAKLGPKASNPEEACSNLYFSHSITKSFLLVSKRGPLQTCPLSGRYELARLADSEGYVNQATRYDGSVRERRSSSPLGSCSNPTALSLSAGCGSSSLTVETECGTGNLTKTSFSCHAHWVEAGRSHLILKEEGTGRTVCLVYAEKRMVVSGEGCGVGPAYTMTETGLCLQALSSHPTGSAPLQLSSSFLLILAAIFIHKHL